MENKIIKTFIETLEKEEFKQEAWAIHTDKEWTKFLIRILKKEVGKDLGCNVQVRDELDHPNSGEYLNIDALFFLKSDFKENRKPNHYAEPVMPIAAVELENNYSEEKIIYCLWKLLCLSVSTRLLVCYQANSDKVSSLKKHIEQKIEDYKLMKQANGGLFVFIGDESESGTRKQKWSEYYRVYAWGNNKLNEVKVFTKV